MEREQRYFFESACDRAMAIVLKNSELKKLYRKAEATYTPGELKIRVLEQAVQSMEKDENARNFFADEESLTSFFCGIWIQFLLIEVGGMEAEKLKTVARDIFRENLRSVTIH
ncbi:hypothetical protein [Thermodesulforhabdus norvegica]|uniref:Uncharacterized protein n=1 Tax=Thermodesulforhabdus norvegica TaxID=39841 RepID=A0A1I4T8Y1_9BACT|nr:hypothetical protein [Thermodesulforhabdus norvegica]SFM73017.1 hypothetical protein SAMN05660836_01287 [Thermodesulforhabdus norvegica]